MGSYDKDKIASEPAVLTNDEREWRAFNSSFSRKSRESELKVQTVVTSACTDSNICR